MRFAKLTFYIFIGATFFTGCFSTKPVATVKTNPYTTTFPPVGWEKLAQIPQKEYLQITPTDFTVVGKSPVISLTQLLEYSGVFL